MFFLSIMVTNKCNLIGGKEKEARKFTEELGKQAVVLHFNENLFRDSFFSRCQMDYYIYV